MSSFFLLLCIFSIKYKCFLNKFIWPTDKTLTGTTTSSQSGPGSNGNEEVLHNPQICILEPHYLMHFSVIFKICPSGRWGGGGERLSLYSQCILNYANKVWETGHRKSNIYNCWYNSSVWTQDIVKKTCQKQWMIGTERERERESQGNLCFQRGLMIYNWKNSVSFGYYDFISAGATPYGKLTSSDSHHTMERIFSFFFFFFFFFFWIIKIFSKRWFVEGFFLIIWICSIWNSYIEHSWRFIRILLYILK